MFFDDLEAQKHSNDIPHKKELNDTKLAFLLLEYGYSTALSLLQHFSLIFSLFL